jgi:hypothetical protein
LLSLLFLVVAIVASGVVLALRGLRLWRNVKSLTRAANAAAGALTSKAATAETQASALSAHTERLTAAVEQLQASLARLAVLRGAANEVKRSVDGLRSAVPRK